ncbi:hypothetical protein CDL15_Pgr023266 [Punica granatum]|uniref:Uncharacterized protein n=1 Tax=Punica granatum TaxID=22663 RepID=A0A218WG24_PUNGR|nr:hypothetical protein CDL15_Pgr023266 [Punica granatum]PKI48952.1 hypothetical protein CRG98_030650 [Punica granatum]
MLGCKGCTFGCAWTSGARAGVREHTGGALERAGARGHAREQASGAWACARTSVWRADESLAPGHAAVSAGVRLRLRRWVYCSPESTSFTRNHLNDLK